MAKTTGISWTRSTFNPYIGCTEVSPGCDACYARELDARHRYGGATHWGAGVPRYRTAASTWKVPERWNQIAAMERETGSCVAGSAWHGHRSFGSGETWNTPGFWPVFPSLCDPFDNEVPAEWRFDFWRLINRTPNLTWLLLTKRIGNVQTMMPESDYPNVWIGASIVNQEEADRDIPKLLAVRGGAKLFISYEPALGPVDFTIPRFNHEHPYPPFYDLADIDQIIVGGESRQGKHPARPFDIEWARSTVRQCKEAGVAVFVKQLGSAPVDQSWPEWDGKLKDRAGADPAEWPDDLRVQEFPI